MMCKSRRLLECVAVAGFMGNGKAVVRVTFPHINGDSTRIMLKIVP